MRRDERQKWLLQRYFFNCACPSCKKLVQADLLLFSFRCPKAGCNGVVPGPSSVQQPDQSVDVMDASTKVSRFHHLRGTHLQECTFSSKCNRALGFPDCYTRFSSGITDSGFYIHNLFHAGECAKTRLLHGLRNSTARSCRCGESSHSGS